MSVEALVLKAAAELLERMGLHKPRTCCGKPMRLQVGEMDHFSGRADAAVYDCQDCDVRHFEPLKQEGLPETPAVGA